MSRVVAILKTAKDYPLWSGLPEHYPVSCVELDSRAEALERYPNATVMSVDDYKEFHAKLSEAHPDPRKKLALIESKNLTAPKGMWRKLWEWLCKLI